MDEARTQPAPTAAAGAPRDPAWELERRWLAGEAPDVCAYAAAGELSLGQLVEVVCVDQRQRRRRGEHVPAEDYFTRFPRLLGAPEHALDVVYEEFLLRERQGEAPALEEYDRRFPDLAEALRRQVEVYRALGGAEAGVEVPGFEVLGELGRGGMGVVYKARQTTLGRLVALKVVLAGGMAGPDDLARFQREARATAALQHPNIIQIHEIGWHRGRPYFTMELLEGGTLATRLGRKPRFDYAAVAADLEALARAAHYAHQRGVIHRDLKPGNVLVGRDGALKLADFGLAKRLDAATAATRTGAVLGTPGYMAPEQVAGATRELGPACDVYALGAILYECLTGRPPFQGENPADVLLQTLGADPPPPSRLLPRVPRDLETICLKCLEKEPRRRYAGALELADDLRRFREGRPILARPTPAWERAAKWARRRPAWAALALFAAVALPGAAAAGLGYAEHERRQADAERRLRDDARRKDHKADMLLAWQAWERADVARVRQLLQKQDPDLRGRDWQYLDGLCRAELRTLDRGVRAPIRSAAFSPDGATVAAGNWDGTVTLWDAASGRELRTLHGLSQVALCVVFSPDGRRLAAGSGDGAMELWDLTRDEAPVTVADERPAQVWAAAFSPDGRRLAWSCNDQPVHLWDAAAGRPAGTVGEFTKRVACLAFSPDGATLAAGGDDRMVHLYDTATRRETGPPLTGHTDFVRGVAFSPDGKAIATAGNDGTVRLWDAGSRTGRAVLQGHDDAVWSVAFAPDGKTLASASFDNTVKLWDLDANGAVERATLKGHSNGVYAVALSPKDGRTLVSASRDGTLKLWDAGAGQSRRTLPHPDEVGCVAFSPDGRTLYSAGMADGSFEMWDPLTGTERASRPGRGDEVDCLAPSPDGRWLATGGRDYRIRLWKCDGASAAPAAEERLSHVVAALAFAPDSRTLLSSDTRGTVRLWDVEEAGLTLRFPVNAHPGWVYGLAVAPDGQTFATGGSDETVRLWDLASGRERKTLTGHTGEVKCVAFSPDGRVLASGGYDASVRLWDAATGAELAVLEGHLHPVWWLAFSPDGRLLASVGGARGRPGEVILWDVAGRQELERLQGHAGLVRTVAFSPDGATLATGGLDRTVKLWNPPAAPR